MTTRWSRRARAFLALSLREQALAGVALAMLGVAAALLRCVRFRRLTWLLGAPHGAVGYSPLLDARATARARLLRGAVGRAAAVAPFRSDCLPQALAAGLMARLLRVPLAIHLGVDLVADGIAAHAWSVAGRVAVSGGCSFGRFTIVGCYVHGQPPNARQRACGKCATPAAAA